MTRRGEPFYSVLIGIVLILLVVFSMLRVHAFRTEFADDPDEAGHFMSGMLVHDYLAQGRALQPMEFARTYYAYYPKIAIGHWPPLFYAIQAAWYAAAGAGPAQVMILQTILFVAFAAMVFLSARGAAGRFGAFMLTAVVVLSPATQYAMTKLLADGLVSMLMFASVLALAAYVSKRSIRWVVLYFLFAVAATFTKANALALFVIVPAAILVSGSFGLLRSRAFWIASVAAAILTALWYVPTWQLAKNGIVSHGVSFAQGMFDLRTYLVSFVQSIGPLAAALWALGLVVVARNGARGDLRGRMCLGYVVGWIVFHAVVPTGGPQRYLLSVLIPAAVLAAEGLRWASARLRGRLIAPAGVLAAASLVVLLVTTADFPPAAAAGYRRAWERIPARSDKRVVLVVSDACGEGALVTRARLDGPLWGTVALRGYEVLAKSDWLGGGYQTLFATDEELRAYLERMTIDYVVLDTFAGRLPHYRQIDRLMRSDSTTFPHIGDETIVRGKRTGTVSLYAVGLPRRHGTVKLLLDASFGGVPIGIEIAR
jgi:hypothetical protein